MRIEDALKYDPQTGLFTWLITQGKARAGSIAGSKNIVGYICIALDGKKYLAHRLAFYMMTGSFPPKHTDHINGIRTDNRFSNLRAVSQSDNNKNHGLRSDNVLGVQGVRFVSNRYRADITSGGRKIYLGRFASLADAERAYKEKARELFGEFARKECAA
jgi:hypothetical protein